MRSIESAHPHEIGQEIQHNELKNREKSLLERFSKAGAETKAVLSLFMMSTAMGCATFKEAPKDDIVKSPNSTHQIRINPERQQFIIDVEPQEDEFNVDTVGASRIGEVEKIPEDATYFHENEDAIIYKLPKGDNVDQCFIAVSKKTKDINNRTKFSCNNDEHAKEVGSEFVVPPDWVVKQVEDYVAIEQELLTAGYLEMPNGKNGTPVPNSEQEIDGKKCHTEVRPFRDSQHDIIFVYTVDEDDNIVKESRVTGDHPDFENFKKLIDADKDSYTMPYTLSKAKKIYKHDSPN